MSSRRRRNPDHGESFVPVPGGRGDDRLAPKAGDHFKRGYHERARERSRHDLEAGNRYGRSTTTGRDGSLPVLMKGFNVTEFCNSLHNGGRFNERLDELRKKFPEQFEIGKAQTHIISAAGRNRWWRVAQNFWKWMDDRNLTKNSFHYNAMISAAEKSRQLPVALNLMKEMDERNVPKNNVTFAAAISACEKMGEWRMAIDLLNRMHEEKIPRSVIAYNSAISACEKGMVPQRAYDIFRRMKADGIKPSVVSYSALISAAEKGGQWRLALEILDEMKGAGFSGNVVAYSAAISALAKGQQWQKALSLFREVQGLGRQPHIVTYNSTMTALEKSLQWERALDLFDEMKMQNLPVTVVSYGSALCACEKGKQYRQCLEFLDEMTTMGIEKNVIIFGAAMSCMEKCHRADIGFQLLERMGDEGVEPNVHVYNSVISACARSDLWQKGHELFLEMSRLGIRQDVVTYNATLDAVASQVALGRSIFAEGVKKGFYAKVSRLGGHWFELDLHFLSLGGGEIAMGWWFEDCLVPYLSTGRLKTVKSICIVTGYGKSRLRGRREGDDGMRKRCMAMLRFMGIKQTGKSSNAGRINICKESLINRVKQNGGKITLDLEAYERWKETECDNKAPNVEQKLRARYKPLSGSKGPPFERVETEDTHPDNTLEMLRLRGIDDVNRSVDRNLNHHGDRRNWDHEDRRYRNDGRLDDQSRKRSFDNRRHPGDYNHGGHYGTRPDRPNDRDGYAVRHPQQQQSRYNAGRDNNGWNTYDKRRRYNEADNRTHRR